MNEIIYVNEAGKLLNYKDCRSVEKWCFQNNVKIFLEEGSRRKYLIRLQFEYARLKKFIQYLKEKYKDKWLQVFKVHMTMDIVGFLELEENGKINFRKNVQYQPQGEHEKSFLAILSTNIHEL
jgi:hypothetical protein